MSSGPAGALSTSGAYALAGAVVVGGLGYAGWKYWSGRGVNPKFSHQEPQIREFSSRNPALTNPTNTNEDLPPPDSLELPTNPSTSTSPPDEQSSKPHEKTSADVPHKQRPSDVLQSEEQKFELSIDLPVDVSEETIVETVSQLQNEERNEAKTIALEAEVLKLLKSNSYLKEKAATNITNNYATLKNIIKSCSVQDAEKTEAAKILTQLQNNAIKVSQKVDIPLRNILLKDKMLSDSALDKRAKPAETYCKDLIKMLLTIKGKNIENPLERLEIAKTLIEYVVNTNKQRA